MAILEKYKRLYPLWEMACTFALILFYGNFALIFSLKFINDHSISALLFLIYELMLVFMLVIRNWPAKISTSFQDWAVAIAGTLLPLVMRPVAVPMEHPVLLLLQMAGLLVSMAGLASLYKSYGTVAANRGVRTSGMYAFIRHPLYSGYFFSLSAFVIMNHSLYNIALYLGFIALKLFRIFAEERLLMQDPVYAAYAGRVRWRILPFVW